MHTNIVFKWAHYEDMTSAKFSCLYESLIPPKYVEKEAVCEMVLWK